MGAQPRFVMLGLLAMSGCGGGAASQGAGGHGGLAAAPAAATSGGGRAVTTGDTSGKGGGSGTGGRGAASGGAAAGGSAGAAGSLGAGGSAGASAGGGFAGGGSGGGFAGSGLGGGGGSGCGDADPETNSSEVFATPLPDITDCDGDGSSVTGVVDGSDVDFFRYNGMDTLSCSVDPTATTSTAGIRVCVFVACLVGATQLESCPLGTPDTSPAGLSGCCSDSGAAQAQLSCAASSDSAAVYIRVDEPGGLQCIAYQVDYHF